MIFLFYLHEAKVNYRDYLEQQFIENVRDRKMKEFATNITSISEMDLSSLNSSQLD